MVNIPSPHTLRRAALHHQGLTRPTPFGKGRQATKKALDQLGYVQIDTLSVVERAHHHTLWTRIPDYQPAHLEQLIEKREAFEYWSHAAAFLPMSAYRFALPRMNAVKRGESRWLASVSAEAEQQVLERIRIDGPLRARDFDSAKEQPGSWWNWKPAKKALEKLFFQGDLMVSSRDGMQKVYDLRERVLPVTVDTREPSLHEYAEYLLDASLKAHGFTTLKQITHLRQGADLRGAVTALLKERVAQGTLAQHKVDGLPPVFAAPDLFERRYPSCTPTVRLLSPFDNAIIHRERVLQLFDFDYKIECYTPQAKRRFGYFCLPLLYLDGYSADIVGRVDCKAKRANRQLEIVHLHIEAPIPDEERFLLALNNAMREFAAFNACDSLQIADASPRPWLQRILSPSDKECPWTPR